MKRYPNTLHTDIIALPGIEMILDLRNLPLPFCSESFDNIYADDIIEHLENVIPTMEECHRMLKPAGKFYMRTTSWKMQNSFRDPTHRHFFTLDSFDFFFPESDVCQKYFWYTKIRFKKLEAREDGQELVFLLEKI
ncbi:MAG: class I SAM-dependent methyltransferase [Gammaproteobacteria bacterium]|nr:class I SAM-dependent methyltransferase [Gammaproteobacteria bacterium]